MKKITRGIVTAFHRYTPFGGEFYEPMLDFYLKTMKEYEGEYDMLYLLDSTWEIDPEKVKDMKVKIIKVDPHLRYYDAYKVVLPQVKQQLVLFMDNDMMVYREGVIRSTFEKLEGEYDVVSIYDTIGIQNFSELGGKSKFCPYWFATGTMMLRDFLRVDWGPNMPESETLGRLTEAMLKEEVIPYEWEEDKSNCLFDGIQDGKKSKDLGYYHIRAGSTPAYLLATKKYGDQKTYNDYITNQPRSEYLRQFAWYTYMLALVRVDNSGWVDTPAVLECLEDMNITSQEWIEYMGRFVDYHGIQR